MKTVSPTAFAKAGLAALSGGKGHIYDRIVLNAAMTDYLLGICPDADEAIQRTKQAIDSGDAWSHLKAYIAKSQLVWMRFMAIRYFKCTEPKIGS